MKYALPSVTKELSVVSYLSSINHNFDDVKKIKALLKEGVCEVRLFELLNQHKVWGTSYKYLQGELVGCFSKEFVKKVEIKFCGMKVKNLELIRLHFLILRAFEKEGVKIAPLKGVELASRLYGDIALRHMNDLDFLISLESLECATSILGKLGFKCQVLSQLPCHMQGLFLSKSKDFTFVHSSGIVLELHVRLTAHSSKLSTYYSGCLLSDSEVKGVDEFVYLSVHGVVSCFHRLKWLSELSLLLKSGSIDYQDLYERADVLGQKRAVFVTLILCRHVFNSQVPDHILEKLSPGWECCLLVRFSLSQIEMENSRILTLIMNSNLSLALSSECEVEKKNALINMFKPNSDDLLLLSIKGRRWHFFYWIIRPFNFIYRKIISESVK